METVLARWGNSLGLRLPKGIANAAGFQPGDVVLIEATEEGIRIKKAPKRPKYLLEELLEQIREDNRPMTVSWNEAPGKESCS